MLWPVERRPLTVSQDGALCSIPGHTRGPLDAAEAPRASLCPGQSWAAGEQLIAGFYSLETVLSLEWGRQSPISRLGREVR